MSVTSELYKMADILGATLLVRGKGWQASSVEKFKIGPLAVSLTPEYLQGPGAGMATALGLIGGSLWMMVIVTDDTKVALLFDGVALKLSSWDKVSTIKALSPRDLVTKIRPAVVGAYSYTSNTWVEFDANNLEHYSQGKSFNSFKPRTTAVS
jgi:hypothetical protein